MRIDPGAAPGAMLPEFVTRALFEPLNVPEVEFGLPFDTGRDDERLPIARALREAVPGRVSRRYGYKRDEHRAWIPLPAAGAQTIELDDTLVPGAVPAGRWRPHGHHGDGIKLSARTASIWSHRRQRCRQFAGNPPVGHPDRPLRAGTAKRGGRSRSVCVAAAIISAGFASHAAGNPVEVRRMTMGADCDTVFQRRSERRAVTYARDGRPAALGFSLDVDAMRVELAPLDLSKPAVRRYLSSPPWRWQAFFSSVAADPRLAAITNGFQRDWLALIYITAFSLAGLGGRPPGQVRADLASSSWRSDLQQILQVLYRDDSQSAGQGQAAAHRLVARLTELSHEPAVVAALDAAGQLLVAPDIADLTGDLAQRAYHDSLAAAILSAALRACPDAQDDDLTVDVIPSPAGSATVWLSETSIGGLGIIEYLIRYYTEDPRRFWSIVAGAQQPNEYEHTDMATYATAPACGARGAARIRGGRTG